MAQNRSTTSVLNINYTAQCGQVVDNVMLQTIYDAALHSWERGDHVFSHGALNLLQIDTSDETKGLTSNNHQYWDWHFTFENGGYNKCSIYYRYRLDGANSGDNGSMIYCKYFDDLTTSIDFDTDGLALTDTLLGANNGLCGQSNSSAWLDSDLPGIAFRNAEQLYEGCITFDIPNPPDTENFVSNAFGVRLGRLNGSTPQSGDQFEYGIHYFNIKLFGEV